MRNKTYQHALVLSALLIFLNGACATHKKLEQPQPGLDMPERYSTSGRIKAPDKWWEVFDDPRLNQLVEESLAENLTLRQAWARLQQARALTRISGAGKRPTIDFSTGASTQYNGEEIPSQSGGSPSHTINSISASVSVAYQVDLWGKIDSQHQADIFDYRAGRKDLESTALTITSSVVDLWFVIAEQQDALELLHKQIKVGEDFLRLVELRFSQGLASAVDVYQQRLQVENTRNQLPEARLSLDLAKNQLAVLLGKPPTKNAAFSKAELSALPPLPETGFPAQLLRKRPDVHAAELRLFAADRRLAVAVADQYPSLNISTALGIQSGSISDLFSNWFINLGANFLGPVFDGGRREAEVERNQAVLRERFRTWESALLEALREVEDALIQEKSQLEIQAGIKEQIRLAEETLNRSRTRYVYGLIDYLNVLTSLQALQKLQRSEIQVRGLILSNRIRLYLALGGTWTRDLADPGEKMIDISGEKS